MSCRKGITVGELLFEHRFSKIAAWRASIPELTNSGKGFGFKNAYYLLDNHFHSVQRPT